MEFTKESNQLFKLFVSKNAQFYYECIIRLIERSKEVPILYERDAKELIIRCFREFQYDPETDDVEPDHHKVPQMRMVRKAGTRAERGKYGHRKRQVPQGHGNDPADL